MCEIQSLIRLQKKGNNGSLIAHLLEEHDATGGSADDVEIIKEVAATVYAGRSIFSDCQILKPKWYLGGSDTVSAISVVGPQIHNWCHADQLRCKNIFLLNGS